MNSIEYWDKIHKLEAELLELSADMLVVQNNQDHEALMQRHFDLMKEKRSLETNRIQEVKKERGLKRSRF